MHTRTLGQKGQPVGAIGLGCMGMTWAYGPGGDEKESIRVIHRALDLGITLLDTSDAYGPFTNEELVGKALAGNRQRAVVATKVGLVRVGDGYEIKTVGTPEHVRRSVDGSLKRLGIDVIDLYQLHRVDPTVPLEETWGAMADLVRAGKVRALGLSEVTIDEIERAHKIHPVTSVQSELSLWTRNYVDNVLPWCGFRGIAFIPFSPLGRGFLTGRFQSQNDFDPGDWRLQTPRFSDQALAENQRLVAAVKRVAERVAATPAQVALAWVLALGSHIVPIPGTRRVERLEENARATEVRLSADDLAELFALPPPVGARYPESMSAVNPRG